MGAMGGPRTPRENLAERVADLTAVAHLVDRRLRRRTWWFAGILAAIIAVGGTTVIWNRVDIQRSNKQWCGMLSILTQPNPPPTSDRGRDSLRELVRLRDSFGCEPMTDPASG